MIGEDDDYPVEDWLPSYSGALIEYHVEPVRGLGRRWRAVDSGRLWASADTGGTVLRESLPLVGWRLVP